MTPDAKPSRKHIAAAVTSLAFGSLVYLARSSDPVAIGWAHDVGFESLARATHDARHFVSSAVHLPAWFRGSASDAAFGFALGAALARASRGMLALGLFVVVGHELGQGLKLFAGTFDPMDLVALVTSYLTALVCFRLKGLPMSLSSFVVRHGRHALVLPLFAFLALGSAPKADGDKSSPTASASATTQLTSAYPVVGSCLKKNSCMEDLPNGRDEWQAKGECTGGLTEHGTWRAGVACPTDRKYLGSCLTEEAVAKYRKFEYLADGETGDATKAAKAGEGCFGKWETNPAFAKPTTPAPAAKPAAKPATKAALPAKKK